MRRTVALAVAAPMVLAAVLGVSAVAISPDLWQDGSLHGSWRTVFNGYGRVYGEESDIVLEPRAVTGQEGTHAALVVTRRDYGDVALSMSVATERQLRGVRPNAWEVGWVLWHYQDPQHFYAVALKPTGWEVSKQDPAYRGGQRFIASGTTPTFAVPARHAVSVEQTDARISVSAGGRLLAAFSDDERPYLSGAVGLYCEDSRVRFRDIQISELMARTPPDRSGPDEA